VHFAVVDIHDELIFSLNASGSKNSRRLIICKVTKVTHAGVTRTGITFCGGIM